jgi:hypothetical protein
MLLVLTLLFASFPVVSAGNQTDYVRYVVGSTIIDGVVADNDGKGIENASITGWAHPNISINVKTDDNGYFRIVLPSGENYEYFLDINENHYGYNTNHLYRGFDNRIIEGTIRSGEHQSLRISLNYDPFDIALAENAGSLERGWTPYLLSQKYEYRMSTDFGGFKNNVKLLGGVTVNTGQITPNKSYYERKLVSDRWFYVSYSGYGSFIDYDSNGNAVWTGDFGHAYTASDGSEIWLDSAFKNVQYRPYVIRTYAHYETWWAGYQTIGGYAILRKADSYWLNFHTRSDMGSGVIVPKQNFAISFSDYLRLSSIDYYRNNGSFVRTDNIYYLPAPWENVQTTVMATPRNGYTGKVKLSLEFDNGITATLGENELTFASQASTTLTITPKENTHGSLHSATLKAHDSNGRLVVGSSRKPALAYNLGLTTPPKPDPITVQYLLSSGTSYISVGVSSVYGGMLPGATVELRYPNGALLASGTTGSNGTVTFTPSPWPLNTNLTVTASYPGYFSGTGSVYTSDGGTRGTSISLTKGDFTIACSRSGAAAVYPNGTQAWNSRGRVKAYVPWESPGWLGGSAGLTGQITFPDYFSGYQFQRNYMNPSGSETSGYDEVEVEATAKTPCSTSCGVRVYGTAGAPTNYQRHTDVPYTVNLQPY